MRTHDTIRLIRVIRVIRLIRVVASRIVGALLRIAKRWAAPEVGPKLAAG